MTDKKETKTKTKKTADVYIEAVGRRKTSVARVRFFAKSDLSALPVRQAGKKTENGIVVNGKKLSEYFPTDELRGIIESPIKKTKLEKYKITAKLSGGGIHSQAEALRHGISRALVEFNGKLRGELKLLGYLTRDPRMKERRKFGLKKARKAPQWSKR